MNFGLSHQLTSFGTAYSLKVYYMTRKNKLSFTLYKYNNYENSYFALETGLFDKVLKNEYFKNLRFDARVMIGTQPRGQEFFTSKSDFFGLASISTNYIVNNKLNTYFQLQYKTVGWVAGEEYLSSKVRARFGLKMIF
jgi:hypothetical protein